MQTKFPTPIAPSLPGWCAEFLLPELSGASLKVLLCIYFHTFRSNSPICKLSIQEISLGRPGSFRGTGLDRSSVRRSLADLQSMGLLRRTPDGTIILRQLHADAKTESIPNYPLVPEDDALIAPEAEQAREPSILRAHDYTRFVLRVPMTPEAQDDSL
jgi:hypothetical protein